MTLYSVLATMLAVIGVISAIVGTGFFAVATNYKQSIVMLKEALDIQKESGLAKDGKIQELSEKVSVIEADLQHMQNKYERIMKINTRLQNENLYWREQMEKLRRAQGLPPIQEYVDDSDIAPPLPLRKQKGRP